MATLGLQIPRDTALTREQYMELADKLPNCSVTDAMYPMDGVRRKRPSPYPFLNGMHMPNDE